MRRFEADVCVVGCGLAGIIVAQRALSRGLKVVVLERGGQYRPHDIDRRTWWSEQVAAVQRGIDGRWTRYKNDFPAAADHFDDLVEIESSSDSWAFRYGSRYGVGGGLAVWHGLVWRLHPNDFRTQSLYGYGQDWPITYEDLAPYYDRAEQLMEVSGPEDVDPTLWPWKNNFQYPAFKQSYLDRRLEAIADGQFRLVLQPHAARNKDEWEGGCIGAKTCVQQCAAGAIFKPHTRMLTELLFKDNFYLADRAAVTHLCLGERGRVRMAGGTSEDGPFEVRADWFFLAANAIENVRILLNSERVTGVAVANGSGNLGRFFGTQGTHTYNVTTAEPVYPSRGRPTHASCIDWLAHEQRKEFNAVVMDVWNSDLTRPMAPWKQLQTLWRDKGVWGRQLVEDLQASERRFSLVYSFELEMLSHNRIVLASRIDKYGIPLARIALVPGPREHKTVEFVERQAERLRATEGVEALELVRRGVNGNHALGGTRMSESPSCGVVNARCRAHDHQNLYILGAGTFCTTGALSPSLTIAALTLRAVDDPQLGWV